MVDFTVPEEIGAVADSLVRFIEHEVIPLEQENAALLADERDRYQRGGRSVPEVRELRRRVHNLCAESAMEIYAARNMVLNCAWQLDQGHRPIKEQFIVKAYASEMLSRVMDRAIQVHGAMGLINELRLEEGLGLARILRVPDGTGEIQGRTIARRLLGGDVRF